MTAINATINTNPFANILAKFSAFVNPSRNSTKISELSQEQIIGSVKNDCVAKLDQKQVTIAGNTVTQLQKQSLKFLQEKANISNEEMLAECQLQAEFVKDRKNVVQTKASMLFARIFPEAVNFMHHVFDTALKVLGFYEVGQENDDMKDATNRLKIYFQILAYPSVIFASLLTVLPVAMAALGTVAILAATLIALGLYIQYGKPCPNTIKGFVNMTMEANRGRYAPVLGRDPEIDAVIQRLRNSEAIPLVGESGCGKSEIVKGVAQRFISGNVPQELKGFQIHSINTAQLADPKAGKIFSNLYEKFAGYEKQVILFLDEFHAAWANQIDKRAAENLKTLIDRFPLVIAASTPTELIQHGVVNDAAICRRLGLDKEAKTGVQVKPMTESQNEMVLQSHMRLTAADIEVSAEVIKYAIEQTNGRPQPFTSKQVMTDAAKRVFRDPQNKLETKISDLARQIEDTKTSYLQGKDVKEVSLKLQELKKSKRETEATIHARAQKIDQIKRVRIAWQQAHEEMLQTAAKITQAVEAGKNCDGLKKKWVVYSRDVLPALKLADKELSASKELEGIKTAIDKELIDEVVSEKVAAAN